MLIAAKHDVAVVMVDAVENNDAEKDASPLDPMLERDVDRGDPAIFRLAQSKLFAGGVLVAVSVAVWTANRNDAESALGRHDEKENVRRVITVALTVSPLLSAARWSASLASALPFSSAY